MISAEKIKKNKKWNRSEENSKQCKDYVNTKHCLLNYSWKHKIKLFTRRICFFFSASQIARDKSSECTVLKGFHLRTFSVSWLQSIIYLSGILVPPHVSSKHSSIEHFFFSFSSFENLLLARKFHQNVHTKLKFISNTSAVVMLLCLFLTSGFMCTTVAKNVATNERISLDKLLKMCSRKTWT